MTAGGERQNKMKSIFWLLGSEKEKEEKKNSVSWKAIDVMVHFMYPLDWLVDAQVSGSEYYFQVCL